MRLGAWVYGKDLNRLATLKLLYVKNKLITCRILRYKNASRHTSTTTMTKYSIRKMWLNFEMISVYPCKVSLQQPFRCILNGPRLCHLTINMYQIEFLGNLLCQIPQIGRQKFEYCSYSCLVKLETYGKFNNDETWIHSMSIVSWTNYGKICHIWLKKMDFKQGNSPKWLENGTILIKWIELSK